MPVTGILVSAAMALVLLLACGNAIRKKVKHDRRRTAFLAQHPDAVKLVIRVQNASQKVKVLRVNGAAPLRFRKGADRGIYLLPEVEHTLNALCELTLPGGVLTSKKIQTEILEFTPAPQKSYVLEFDDKTRCFVIRDFSP